MKKILVILSIIGLLFSGCSNYHYNNPNNSYIDSNGCNVSSYNLYSLNLNNINQISGAFFLGIGGVSQNNDGIYYFYLKSDKGYRLHSLKMSENTIYIKLENTTPKLITNTWMNEAKVNKCGYVTFVIPEGSIKNQYNPNI